MIAVKLKTMFEAEAKARQISALKQGAEAPVPPDLEERGEAIEKAAELMNVAIRMKAAIRIKIDEASEEYARRKKEIEERANRARADKAKAQPREGGGFGSGQASPEARPEPKKAAAEKLKREDPEAFEALALMARRITS